MRPTGDPLGFGYLCTVWIHMSSVVYSVFRYEQLPRRDSISGTQVPSGKVSVVGGFWKGAGDCWTGGGTRLSLLTSLVTLPFLLKAPCSRNECALPRECLSAGTSLPWPEGRAELLLQGKGSSGTCLSAVTCATMRRGAKGS